MMEIASSTLEKGLFGRQPASRPTKLPSSQAISVDESRSPKVQGRASPINWRTGVGYIASEGPKSPVNKTRFKNLPYWLKREPFRPNESARDSRSASVCAALMKDPWEETFASIA